MRSLGALLIVLAIFIAVLFGAAEPLGGVMYELHPPLVSNLQMLIQRWVSPWLWDHVCMPVLAAPAWAVLTIIGILMILIPSLIERWRD